MNSARHPAGRFLVLKHHKTYLKLTYNIHYDTIQDIILFIADKKLYF